MATLSLSAVAKLNLFLHITGQRHDGYHLLETLFQFIDYGDRLDFTLTDTDTLDFSCSVAELAGPDNLVLRAVQLLQQEFPKHARGVRIHLHKVLPCGGGLGGGSSDAATTLLALRQLWQLPLSTAELAQLGLQLGADVPIFVSGHAAFAQGIGEQLTPMTPACPWYLVVHPGVHVSTPTIFQHPQLPRQHAHMDPQQWNWHNTQNDCQQLVCQLYPEVAKALAWLVEYAPSRLTGTGACIFARFDQQQQALAALQQLPAAWTGFVARGINESPVCQQLRQASTVT
ncbi:MULTISPECIES: 4-(cytidine 5'-diphospho)-2-C-methyl-D-erythritol kinase [Idiomarina]|uniref:4-(cytidine 5'-diphospho)-2-C-methyl-D-erythritol kinase n=1 Tax=Idiomarina TaxID=135575 RepID=UPI00129A8B13|nr:MULTISPECIES: 4-(cytidine 5'-diphospho)-2-C-methyl-D-erythritol kinase [Idiomarina]MRJ41004.1 4-(cytidine 5'-diphospho)-2-C-methyl-D-erythritol kinase [Idiomarina sp. FeN1]NCU56169.1 4-(cytidine 5'-diphospho)-2-C-methyl-D-erythritol kinase [Idiomarina sp. FenA--70]NCU59188.1 4-(cytidine 5'-diphospho)-2-C-methyl-D-erythritol kinase [Idiomarina sp. FenBw--71]UUN14861.1 4-(cytidine 5'-diphospho)-2-C-methyl-D-erythritol kinase [Idiomarina loihiensis]